MAQYPLATVLSVSIPLGIFCLVAIILVVALLLRYCRYNKAGRQAKQNALRRVDTDKSFSQGGRDANPDTVPVFTNAQYPIKAPRPISTRNSPLREESFHSIPSLNALPREGVLIDGSRTNLRSSSADHHSLGMQETVTRKYEKATIGSGSAVSANSYSYEIHTPGNSFRTLDPWVQQQPRGDNARPLPNPPMQRNTESVRSSRSSIASFQQDLFRSQQLLQQSGVTLDGAGGSNGELQSVASSVYMPLESQKCLPSPVPQRSPSRHLRQLSAGDQEFDFGTGEEMNRKKQGWKKGIKAPETPDSKIENPHSKKQSELSNNLSSPAGPLPSISPPRPPLKPMHKLTSSGSLYDGLAKSPIQLYRTNVRELGKEFRVVDTLTSTARALEPGRPVTPLTPSSVSESMSNERQLQNFGAVDDVSSHVTSSISNADGIIVNLKGTKIYADTPYQATLGDELDIEAGDCLQVYEVFDDGWCKATIIDSVRPIETKKLLHGACPMASLDLRPTPFDKQARPEE